MTPRYDTILITGAAGRLGTELRRGLAPLARKLRLAARAPITGLAPNEEAMALDLADATPLVWGGSVLAARASRRVAEAVRTASGRVALAADAGELLPILAGVRPRDPFADPFEGSEEARPTLVVVDDGLGDAENDEQRSALEENARVMDVRVTALAHTTGSVMERYATVLAKGLFAAAYLQIGLGREYRR